MRRSSGKRPRALDHALHLVSSITFFTIALTAAFYASDFVYRKAGLHPPPLLALFANAILAVFFLVLGVNVAGLFFRSRRKDFFAPIAAALDPIAAGDFTARLDESAARGPLGQIARTVNQTAARLDQMEKMRQEFVSNVSHEIQSPITSICGFAAALRQPDLSHADRARYLEIIEAESLRLSRLGANLLKLASLESDRIRLAPCSYRVDKQIREVILACETQWAEKRLELDLVLDEIEITADQDLLNQVWTNLIHNAIKFTPADGSIRVTAHAHGGRLELSVADTGIGISPEDLPRIFERFFKADPARQSSNGGSGLGLAIAKRIVEMHGGTVTVRSQAAAGAEFVVLLPLAVPRETVAAV